MLFTIDHIATMVSMEFRSLIRYDEHLVISLEQEIKNNIQAARDAASDLGLEHPTDQQERRYLKAWMKCYSRILGVYSPAMPKEKIKDWVRQHRFVEKYGEALAIIIGYRRLDLSDKITYFLDSAVAHVWDVYTDGFLRDKDVVTYIQRKIRLLIGHERRHKIQYRLHFGEEMQVLLHCNDVKASLNQAKEDDANWWAWCFNDYGFGDQVARI